MIAHSLITTVGTSLLSNLQQLKPEADEEVWRAYQAGKWSQVCTLLQKRSPADRLCGAEINSIQDLSQRGLIRNPPFVLHFCVSDTQDGGVIGEVLMGYYQAQGLQAKLHSIAGLQDAEPARFRTEGLRNLAREIGGIVRAAGDPRCIAINATGGYKAQIAIAALIGQMLQCQVFYKHERFSEIIAFPPMPVSFDYDLITRQADMLVCLERNELLEVEEDKIDPALRVLLEEAPSEGGKKLWALAPIGQIYLEGFRQRHPADRTLPPASSNRSKPSFRDDHYPEGFRDFVEKVWREQQFINSCHSLPYDRQRSICDRTFYVRDDGQIVGEYVDRRHFGARFAINTTAETVAQRAAVVLHLNQEYGHE